MRFRLHHTAFCLLLFLSPSIGVPAQEGRSKGPENWKMLPLSPRDMRALIAQSKLVAKARVLQFWPAQVDPGRHEEDPEHSSLLIEKVFQGKISPGETLDFVCICSHEEPTSGLTPGTEIVIFANTDGDSNKAKQWFPAGKQYEVYYLDYSAWLDRQITERTRPR